MILSSEEFIFLCWQHRSVTVDCYWHDCECRKVVCLKRRVISLMPRGCMRVPLRSVRPTLRVFIGWSVVLVLVCSEITQPLVEGLACEMIYYVWIGILSTAHLLTCWAHSSCDRRLSYAC